MRLSAAAQGDGPKGAWISSNLSIGLRSLLWTSLRPTPKTNWKFIVIGLREAEMRGRQEGIRNKEAEQG